MRTFAIAVAALASATLWTGPCDAKTTHHAKPAAGRATFTRPITTDQANAVAGLAKTGLSIQADLNGAIADASGDPRRRGDDDGAGASIECFQVLEGATAELTGDLKELLVATATASLAKDRSDVATALGFTRLALADVGDSVMLVEKVTSERPSRACQSSRLYREQVDRLQTFAHDVTLVTDDLSGATGPQ